MFYARFFDLSSSQSFPVISSSLSMLGSVVMLSAYKSNRGTWGYNLLAVVEFFPVPQQVT